MKNFKLISVTLLIFLPVLTWAQANAFTRKYAGTYHMLVAGGSVTTTSDKYILKPDGIATWTFFSDDGTGKSKPTVNAGKWTAAEGHVHLSFDMGEGEGSELISDFHYENGAFRGSEGIYLKKSEPKKAGGK